MDFEEALSADIPRGLEDGRDQPAAARWATRDDLKADEWCFTDDHRRLLLGYRGGSGKGVEDDRHMVTVAGSRAGKGVSFVIPNLLLYAGSALVIDPKGELAKVTKAERERMGQACYVLDPFGANGLYETAAYNPLAEIDPYSPNAIDDAALIADSLILEERGESSHWTESAKLLLRGLILFALASEEHERNLVTVRKLLMLSHYLLATPPRDDDDDDDKDNRDEEKERKLFKMMANAHPDFDLEDVLAATGEAFLAMPPKESGSIISTARTQTAFLDSPQLRAMMQGGSLRLGELKREKITVYLCLPASHMGTHARWLRVIINLALTLFERDHKTKPNPSVLMVLEEFAVLGHMQRIEVAAGQIAGFGVKLWAILQDLTQLQRHYRESWETFIGNAGVLTFFANSDVTTCEYISKKLGAVAYKIVEGSKASVQSLLGGASPTQESLRVDQLLAPYEVERVFARRKWRVLVLAQDHAPAILQRADYRRDVIFKGKFDAD
jgi:type IV secretion system protein VirD4